MDANRRRALAYVAARLALHPALGAVCDPDTGLTHLYAGEVTPELIRAYDYARSPQLVGRWGALYDTGVRAPIQLCVHGRKFYGYDYLTHRKFDGDVGNERMSLYDASGLQRTEYLLEFDDS
jgi:hypothetical protein